MSRIPKLYVRNTRDELGRYPTWPPQRRVELGDIAIYSGRRAEFDFVTSIHQLGIAVRPNASQGIMAELYTTMQAVNLKFGPASSDVTKSSAQFTFRRAASVATQGFQMSHVTLPIDRLRSAIDDATAGGVMWDPDWLVVTEIWHAEAFTTLIASSKASEAEVAAKVEVPGHAFNIADVNLGLHVARSAEMTYQAVCDTAVHPFFQVHKRIFDSGRKSHYLKVYGRDARFFR